MPTTLPSPAMLLLDARYLAQPTSGIPRYCLNVLRSLRAAEYPQALRVLVPTEAHVPDDLATHTGFDFVFDTTTPRAPADQLRWPARLRHLGVTALHCPDAFGPLRPALPTAITLHDVIPLVCAGELPRSRKQQLLPLWRQWLRLQTRTAHTVVTVSHHSANDLQTHLGIHPERVTVIPNAVPEPPPPRDDQGRLDKLGLKPPFVLHVGRFDPYKNVPLLIDAFAELLADPKRQEQLVLVGKPDPRYPEAQERVEAHGLHDRVVFTDAIADDALHALYRQAALLVMPSRYEGFGLPAVEAMHAGTPVVASNRGSLPEVVGEAALLVEPASHHSLAHAMRSVLENPHRPAALVRAGHRRKELYRPDVIGRHYAALYDRLLHANRRTIARR